MLATTGAIREEVKAKSEFQSVLVLKSATMAGARPPAEDKRYTWVISGECRQTKGKGKGKGKGSPTAKAKVTDGKKKKKRGCYLL